MKRVLLALSLVLVAMCVAGCLTAPKRVVVAVHWDDEFVTLWATKAKERGMTVGESIDVGKRIQSEADVLQAVKKAERQLFSGGYVADLRIDQFRKVEGAYVVCITDGSGVCYFLTKLGESTVIYRAVGTIAQ